MSVSNEISCGHSHRSIHEARRCAEALEQITDKGFGDLTAGVNLWWGKKMTGKLRNAGLVIGLNNREAKIGWRLDFDPIKKIHLNQFNDNIDHKADIYHPIDMFSFDPEKFVFNIWATWTKLNESKIPADVAERIGSTTIEDFRSLRRIT